MRLGNFEKDKLALQEKVDNNKNKLIVFTAGALLLLFLAILILVMVSGAIRDIEV